MCSNALIFLTSKAKQKYLLGKYCLGKGAMANCKHRFQMVEQENESILWDFRGNA